MKPEMQHRTTGLCCSLMEFVCADTLVERRHVAAEAPQAVQAAEFAEDG